MGQWQYGAQARAHLQVMHNGGKVGQRLARACGRLDQRISTGLPMSTPGQKLARPDPVTC